jgi:hypothetical protein
MPERPKHCQFAPSHFMNNLVRAIQIASVTLFALALTRSPSLGQNLIQNPGFEQGTDGWSVHDNMGILTLTTNFAHSGSWAALVSNRTATQGGVTQSLLGRLLPGTNYQCSAWVRVLNGNAPIVKMTFRQIDGRGTRYYIMTQVSVAANTWTRLSGSFTFNPNGTVTSLELYLEGPPAALDFLADDVSVSGPGQVESPVTLTSPTNSAVFLAGNPIPVTASLSTNLPNLPASRVDFYQAGIRFASVTNPPYSAMASNAPPGSNSLFGVAVDSLGLSYTSTVVNVLVLNEGLTLLAPTDGTVFTNTSPLTVSAMAMLPAGSITNVEFFVDGQKFGEDAAAPFSAIWSNVTGGSHRLNAVGRADTGAAYSSQSVYVGVRQSLVLFNSVWKYLDNGSDQGAAWRAAGFDDRGWSSGSAPLGYGDANGLWPATTNSFGPESMNKYTTTYYRQSVVVSNVTSYTNLLLRAQRDDGLVVYLNGYEVFRQNLPTGAVDYRTFASSSVSGSDEVAWYSTYLSPLLVGEGTNVLAAEVH